MPPSLYSRFLSLFLAGSLLPLVCPLRMSAQDPPGAGTIQPARKSEATTLPNPPAFALEDGTPVRLRLTRELSSADATKGETVDFRVVEAVKVHDVVVIPEGSIAWATVTETQHKRRMGRGGKLNLAIDKVRLADGARAPLRAVKDIQGAGHVGAMTTAMVATGIFFFPVAPLFLFVHGKDVKIPEGTEITAYVNGDFALDHDKFAALATQKASTTQESAAGDGDEAGPKPDETPGTIVLNIKSEPSGADVYLDGNFVGDTPSSLQVAAGDHHLKVSTKGYRTWETDLKVDAKSPRDFLITLIH